MTKIYAIHNTYKVKYLHWVIILLIALLIAHLIVTESQQKPVLILVHQTNYQLAMAFSWPFTFFMMLWIHLCTIKLDVYVPWTTKWPLRLAVQFLLCVVLVLFIDVIFVKSYFDFLGGNFKESGYMEIEFPIVRWMVLFMNALYIAWFFAVNYYKSTKMNDGLKDYISFLNNKREKELFFAQKIEAKLGKKIIQLELNEVACFGREENIGYVYLLDGRKFNMDYTLNKLHQLLNERPFYQINRSVMISFMAIEGYEKVKNRQATIILKDGLEIDVSLLVSRDRFNGFKERFEMFKLS